MWVVGHTKQGKVTIWNMLIVLEYPNPPKQHRAETMTSTVEEMRAEMKEQYPPAST